MRIKVKNLIMNCTLVSSLLVSAFLYAAPASVQAAKLQPPAKPTVLSPSAALITNDPTPTITVQSEEGTKITVVDSDTNQIVGSGTGQGSGNNVDITVNRLTDGLHNLVVFATNSLSLNSPNVNVPKITIDTVSPPAPVVQIVATTDTSVKGNAEQGSMVKVNAGGTELGSAKANGSTGKFTVNIPVQSAGTVLTVTATDTAGNVSEAAETVVRDFVAPKIVSADLAINNSYMDIVFSKPVYSTSNGSGAVKASDLYITFAKGGGKATDAVISGVSSTDGSPLTGGESAIRVKLAIMGTPSGKESVKITPLNGSSIYDVWGNAMLNSSTTGAIKLNVYVPADISALVTIIGLATTALNGTAVGSGVGQVSQGDHDALAAALGIAQGILNTADTKTQAEVNAAATNLENALASFNSAKVQPGDATALFAKIGEATSALETHGIGEHVGEVSQAAHDALAGAIGAAQGVYAAAATKTQAELNAATTVLHNALATFNGAVEQPGGADGLQAKIEEATLTLGAHGIGAGVGQVSQDVHDALSTAIGVAQDVYNAASSKTQGELDTAVAALQNALTAFNGAIVQPGGAEGLQVKIEEATLALGAFGIGAGVGQVPQDAHDALNTAISIAQDVYDAASSKTQGELDGAVAALQMALAAFNGAVVQAGSADGLQAEIESATTALGDHMVGSGVGQVPQTAHDELDLAISEAQTVLNDATTKTQGELDAAVTALHAVLTAFNGAVVQAGGTDGLEAEIQAATSALSNHTVGAGVGQVPQTAHDELEGAIVTAQAVLTASATKTQGELDAAITALHAALTAFNGAVVQAGGMDGLEAEIQAATSALGNHTVGSAVGQVSQTAHDELSGAVVVAQTVLTAAATKTQDELDTAVSALSSALSSFTNNIIQAGDASALTAKIGEAISELGAHPVGTGVGQVSQAAHDELDGAISEAQAVLAAALTKTQDELNTATTELNTVLVAFNGAVVQAGDASALTAKIGEATSALGAHPVGTGVGQVSQAAHDELDGAISEAQAVLAAALTKTQDELNTATTELNTVLVAFNGAVVQAGDVSALTAKIGEATSALGAHPVGTGVGQVSQAAHDELDSAISEAQVVLAAALTKTQEELNTATAELNEALVVFSDSVVQAGDASALTAKIGEATSALGTHPVGTGVGQVSQAAHDELASAISEAHAVLAAALSKTQDELDTAVTALSSALASFTSNIIQVGDASALTAKIGEATTALGAHSVGTGVGQVSQSTHNNLAGAISEAQTVLTAALTKTQVELDTAVTALSSALASFTSNIIQAGNASALTAKIGEATTALGAHTVGSGVGHVLQSVHDALDLAITIAQGVYNSRSTKTQADLDEATANLNNALILFNNAIITNTDPIAENPISDKNVTLKSGSFTVDATNTFTDADQDPLTLTVLSSDTSKVAVSVNGKIITVTPVARGTATITVTASDGKGGIATDTFSVTVENVAPVLANPIANQIVTVGAGSITVDATNTFTDEDGDPLTLTVASSAVSKATVSVNGKIITINPVARGTTTVTVTANDGYGGIKSTTFEVLVNEAPKVANAISDKTLTGSGSSSTVNATNTFTDADGDPLTITVSSDNPSKVTASISGTTITITAVARGTAIITVSASDNKGGSVSTTFKVTVGNSAPTVANPIPDKIVLVGSGSFTVDAANTFTDADGDNLTLTASSSSTSRVTVSVSGKIITVNPVSRGSATITVTANDGNGGTKSTTFIVTVNAAPTVANPISDRTLTTAGNTTTINASNTFADADGDALTLTVSSSDTSKVTVSISGTTITVKAVAHGTATITVTASDGKGGVVSTTFDVMVNRAPTVASNIPNQTLSRNGSSKQVDVSSRFTDPDNDTWTIDSVSSDRTDRVTVSFSGKIVTITPKNSTGSATITVTVKDSYGATVSTTFNVTVS